MQKKYLVRLTTSGRTEREAMVKKGKAAAYRIKHANILLAADVPGPAWPDRQIGAAFCCHPPSAENVRRRLVLEGLAAALERKKQTHPLSASETRRHGRSAIGCSGLPPASRRPGSLDPPVVGRRPGRVGGSRLPPPIGAALFLAFAHQQGARGRASPPPRSGLEPARNRSKGPVRPEPSCPGKSTGPGESLRAVSRGH